MSNAPRSLSASFPQPRRVSPGPQEKVTAADERGGGRNLRRTPGTNLTQHVGERRVVWPGCSCCTAWAWSSVVPFLHEVHPRYNTRNLAPSKVRHCAKGMSDLRSEER